MSTLLALASSVREGDILRHTQAESEMLKQVFLFDHQNYSHHVTWQHDLPKDLQQRNTDAFLDLKNNDFGENYSESSFTAVLGNLVTEYYHRETKGNARSFRMRFSTDLHVTRKMVEHI